MKLDLKNDKKLNEKSKDKIKQLFTTIGGILINDKEQHNNII